MRTRRAVTLSTVLAVFLLVLPAGAAPEQTEVIVVLESTDRPVADVANEVAQANSAQVGFVYTTALQGFTLTLPEQAVAGLSHNPNVAYIEPVQEVAAVGTQPIPTGIDRIDGDLNPPTTSMDVDIAVLDTGVYIGTNPDGTSRSHLDLNLRWVSDCTGAILYPLLPGGCSGSGDFQDYHGHGTHVAGIAAAYDNDIGSIGVAPGATLWSFKVLQADGTGTTGMILAGIDAVASQADQIEVANMSLGFLGTSQAIDDSLANAKAAGVVFVVAAGNDGVDASEFSPASSPSVVTVSALADFDGLPGGLGAETCRSDVDDTLADFSNFGPLVEIAAPGVCIFSSDLNDGYSTKSGTSMASPFVAGAVARYIAETGAPTNNAGDVDNIVAAVIGSAIPQTDACGFSDVDSSPEPLLSVNGPAYGGDGTCGSGGEPPTNNPPVAGFTHVCADLECTFTNTSSDPNGDPLTYSWTFGDGNTSTAANPTHTYGAGGNYTVTLTTSDATLSDSFSDTTSPTEPTTNNPPTASYISDCTDLTCTFTNTSTDPDNDPLTYLWDFGDGQSSTAVSPSHDYASAGTYDVTLTADDGTDSSVATDSVSPTAPPPPPSSGLAAIVAPFSFDGKIANVSITVWDGLTLVGGATVEGTWTFTDKRGKTRTTTSSTVSSDEFDLTVTPLGNANMSKRFPKGSAVTGFCLTSVTAPGYDDAPLTDPCVGLAEVAVSSTAVQFKGTPV